MVARSQLGFLASLMGVLWLCGLSAAPSTLGPVTQNDWSRTAPWTGVRFEDDGLEVEVDGEWWRLGSIQGVSAADLMEHSQRAFGSRWQKRIVEDIVEVLEAAGASPSREVELVLVDLETGDSVTHRSALTHEKRRRAKDRFDRGGEEVARIERVHAKVVDPRYSFLARRVAGDSDAPTLAADAAARDLDQLEARLRTYPYLGLTDVDIPAALDAIRLSLGDRVPRDTFGIQIAKFLALLGDGHTRVREANGLFVDDGFLPFILVQAEEGWIGVREDRSGPAIDGFPVVTHLDGVELSTRLEAAGRYVPQGSPQFVRASSARMVRFIQQVRREVELEETPTVQVRATSLDGSESAERTLELAPRRPLHGVWPRKSSRLIDGRVGYLRIPSMTSDEEGLRELDEWMSRFRNTEGLIVDVRGNRGGSRRALRTLAPYLLSEAHPVLVANVACTPASDGSRVLNLALFDRYLFPLEHFASDSDASRAVHAVARDFEPARSLPSVRGSSLHFMAITPDVNPEAYRYEKPVIVLCDSDCFSATDIFVGALERLPQVTVIGTATGGGSGRARRVRLAESGIELQVSTMASFRPDGRLYDGVGIAPDIEVYPKAQDLYGSTDQVLEVALERLK